MIYHQRLRIFALIVSLLIVNHQVIAQETVSPNQQKSANTLSTPRKAVHTFLHWQQEGHERPELAARTMALANADQQKKIGLAGDLLMILDSRGLIIDYEQIPNNPNYVDSLSGMHQYILFDELPEVYLVKEEGKWLFSKATIDEIPELYRETFSLFIDVVVDNLPDSLRKDWLGLEIWQYLAIFIWLLLGIVLRMLFEMVLDRYAQRFVKQTDTVWDDQLVKSVEKPVSFLFMMLFYLSTYSNLMLSVSTNFYLSTALEIAVTASFVWLIYNMTDVFSHYLIDKTSKTESKLDDQLVPLVRKTLKIFVVVLGVIFILQNQGVNVASLLAGLGLGGLAFALAARETLANFFGSITIFMDKPFQVGDLIDTPEVSGTVEEVGFRSTRVRTFHNSLVSVPNAKLADAEIDNLGLRQYRRLKTTLNLTYSTTPKQMEAFVEGIKAIIKSNPSIRQDFYEVHFYEFGAHSLDVLIYIFFDVPDWHEELENRHNFLLEIFRLAETIGVEFAFPTQTLHVDSFYGDEPRTVGEQKNEEQLTETVIAFGPEGELSKPGGVKLTKNGDVIDFSAGK